MKFAITCAPGPSLNAALNDATLGHIVTGTVTERLYSAIQENRRDYTMIPKVRLAYTGEILNS